jgi:deoxyribose-phosphate aldolase
MDPAEILRIVEQVVADVDAAGGHVASRCACHGRPVLCCPFGSAAARHEGHARPELQTPAAVAALIDHTLLKPDATRGDIEALCDEAAGWRFASVCVNPVWVATCAERLDGAGPPVCAVVGFPLGATTTESKVHEAMRAIADGAFEIDMVLQVGMLRSGLLPAVAEDIAGVTAVCRARGARSKVILETALLRDEEKVAACVLAHLAGADFVKTSTGFGPGGATVADVALLRTVVGTTMGVKASGGIRDLAALRAMVSAGASRIGTSSGVRILRDRRFAQDPA